MQFCGWGPLRTHVQAHTYTQTLTCEADRTLEGAAHALEAVLDQVTQELGRRVKHLVTQLALVIDAFLCKRRTHHTTRRVRK